MSITFMTTALFIISAVTNLTVEGIKKLLNGTKVKYSSNVMAVIVSAIIALGTAVVYLAVNDISMSFKVAVEMIVMVYLSFLVSTIGYDKVVQTIKQIASKKDDENHH